MKMTRMVLFAAAAFLPAIAFADICSDLATSYGNRILALQRDTQAVLSQTTDPAEQAAIQQSYTVQKGQLVMEMDAALTSAGCNTNVPVPPDPTPPPTPPPAPVPTPPPPPPPPVVTPPPPPVTTPPPGPSCKDELDSYTHVLKGQHLCARDILQKVQAKSHELDCDGNDNSCHHASDCDHNHRAGTPCNHNLCHHASDCDHNHSPGSPCNHNLGSHKSSNNCDR